MTVEIKPHYKYYRIEVGGVAYINEYLSYEAAAESDVYKFFTNLFKLKSHG